MIAKQSEKISKWNELSTFFNNRTKSPIDHPEFIFYFIIVIIGFGAIGVWTSWYTESHNSEFNHVSLIGDISSFSLAVLATGSIELMFIQNKYINRTLFLISVGIISIASVLFFITMDINSIDAYLIAIPLSILSLYIWWIANAENANLTKNFFVSQSEKSKELNKSIDDYDE